MTEYLNRVQTYVVSPTMTDPGWKNSRVLSGDPLEEVRALKDRPGQDIVVTGSITLCHTLIHVRSVQSEITPLRSASSAMHRARSMSDQRSSRSSAAEPVSAAALTRRRPGRSRPARCAAVRALKP